MNIKSFKRIGVIDSGLGGLTVLKPLLEYYPAQYIYVADTANLPYGQKTTEQIRRLSMRIVDFLIDQKVDACIVACHTICAATLSFLENVFAPLPFFGMIDLSCKQAVSVSKTNKIGVIATTASIMRHAHKKELLKLNSNCIVAEQACPRLVPLIEYHYDNKRLLNGILQEDLWFMKQTDIDTLILGSTHYTLIRDEIQRIVGAGVNLVAANETVAQEFIRSEITESTVQFYVTGSPDEFQNKCKSVLHWQLKEVELTGLDASPVNSRQSEITTD